MTILYLGLYSPSSFRQLEYSGYYTTVNEKFRGS